jgi:4-aminobutyrate aminotransferase/(S)-3-amino-2-methylpropionate transaminase
MAQRLSAVESRNVTYRSPRFPVFWEAARGANVRDVDGNVFLDLTAAFGVAAAGHGDGAMIEAIREQSGRLVHGMGDVHPPAGKVEFLEALADLAPWPESRAILGSSGSEAVEAALKTALMATGRPGILAFEGAYHGLTLGSLAATARHHFRAPFRERLYPGVRFVPFPDPLRSGETAGPEALAAAERALGEGIEGSEIGAVIIEPVQGRAGVRIPPPGFLRELGALARDAGAILIFDEIFTGLGRTGSLFACTQEDVLPDLLCLGKGLGGGLPLSACVGPPEVMDAWPRSEGEAIHTSTFLGHPLACASGRAMLRELERRDLVARSMDLGAAFREGLRRELAGETAVVDVRGRGLFIGVELADPKTLVPRTGAAVAAAEGALRRGILVLPAGSQGHVLELSPPLVITEEQIEWAIARLGESIREGRGPVP